MYPAIHIANLLVYNHSLLHDEPAEDEAEDVVRYGDRVCLLCDGQLLALAHRLNLSFPQLAMLALSACATGGLMAIAGYFVMRKGLFRRRYAALLADELYDDDSAPEARKLLLEDDPVDQSEPSEPATPPTALLAFRFFAVDASGHELDLAAVGRPVRLGEPLVVVHAASHRALAFHPKGGAVTLKRPPKNLHFARQVKRALAAQVAAVRRMPPHSTGRAGGSRPQSLPASRLEPLPLLATLPVERQSTPATDDVALPNWITGSRVGRYVERRKRARTLLQDLPNMTLAHPGGRHYLATLEPVGRLSSSSKVLKWGTPVTIAPHATACHEPCAVLARTYHRDNQLYLSSSSGSSSSAAACAPSPSFATLIPLRENVDMDHLPPALYPVERRRVNLTVGTYNVWMLPRRVSAFTAVSPKKNTRARLIADVLPPCDVWVFTECFDHRSRALLLSKLSAAGYCYSTPSMGRRRGSQRSSPLRKLLDGGVVVASKFPILTVKIKLFQAACCGADALADKGVLYCKVLKHGLVAHVFATHLQAWNDSLARSMRRTQIEAVRQLRNSLAIDPARDAVLYVGDMNVNYWLNKTTGEYDEMLSMLEAKDPALVVKDKVRTTADVKKRGQFSFDGRVNALAAGGLSSDGSLELLDYVLYSKTHREPARAESYVLPLRSPTPWTWRKEPQFNLSDHFPVVADMDFDV